MAQHVVNPAYGFVLDDRTARDAGEAAFPAPASEGAPRVALFSNSKPNASSLLRRLGDGLVDEALIEGYDLVAKPQASQPADEDLLGRISRDYRVALLALAD